MDPDAQRDTGQALEGGPTAAAELDLEEGARKRVGRPRSKPLGPFGVALRRAIREHGGYRSRAHFLRRMRIEPATVYRYETGERRVPADLVKRFADALEVTVDALLRPDPAVDSAEGEEAAERPLEASSWSFRRFLEVYRRVPELEDAGLLHQLARMKFRGGPPRDVGVYVEIAERLLDGGGASA